MYGLLRSIVLDTEVGGGRADCLRFAGMVVNGPYRERTMKLGYKDECEGKHGIARQKCRVQGRGLEGKSVT